MFSFRKPKVDLFAGMVDACRTLDEDKLLGLADQVGRDRKGYAKLWDWAIVNLEAWGLNALLGHAPPTAESLRVLFEALSSTAVGQPEEHQRLKTEIWPAVWADAQMVPDRMTRLLPEVYLAHYMDRPLDLPLLDLPEGPFSAAYHKHLVFWHPRGEVWVGDFTPLQVAWFSQNFQLIALLVKHGAALAEPCPSSLWPQWTLQSAIDNPFPGYGESLRHVDHYGHRKLLEAGEKKYDDTPGALQQLKQAVRVGLLDQGLPAPRPSRPGPRF